ncbi:MAG: glycosyltransferase family 39 protein [Thermomicrobiales bacterium]
MTIAEPASPDQRLAPPEQHATGRSPLVTPAIMLGLYALAALLLLLRLGQHPAYAFNWEPYTAYGLFAFWDHPSFHIFRATDGLITDSSFSPFVILPGWLAFTLGGVGLTSMRVATALIAAGAVPLLWWTGRHFIGPRAAGLAALLLALSPVYLLYGRTATLVALSLVPALITVEALRRFLHHPGDRRWLLFLQAALILNTYGYAPLRFLWLVAVAFLGLEAARRPLEWPALRNAFFITLLVPWLGLSLLALRDPATALALYFQGRGEHVFGLSFTTSQYGFYIRQDPSVPDPGPPQGSPLVLAIRLITQNLGDFTNLLLDRHTIPALADAGTEHGRLYPLFLAPFFALGLLLAAFRARRRLEDLLLLGLAAAWTLPLLLTSKVYVGRLIFFLPILCLLVASGLTRPTQWLADRIAARSPQQRPTHAGAIATTLVATLLLAAVASATWRDYRQSPLLEPDAVVAAILRNAATPDSPAIALILRTDEGDDPTHGVGEATQIAALRLSLDALYQPISLYSPSATPTPTNDPRRIPLYYGNLLALLDNPDDTRLPCNVTYYIASYALDQFQTRYAPRRATCGEPRFVVLP